VNPGAALETVALAALEAWYDFRLRFLPHAWNRRLLFGSRDGAAEAATAVGPAGSFSVRLAAGMMVAARRASRLSPERFTCLRMALALHRRLNAKGVRTGLVYGVRRLPGGATVAHAWLTYRGRSLDPYADAAYSALEPPDRGHSPATAALTPSGSACPPGRAPGNGSPPSSA